MNKKLLKVLAVTILSFGSAAVSASPIWLNGVTVKSVYPYSDGSFVVTLSSSPSTCTNTAAPDKYFYVTVNSAPNGTTITEIGARNLLAVTMQAMALGKTVNVLFDSATTNCYVNAMIMFN